MAEEFIPIVQRAYDFAVNLYLYVNRFPRAHKPLIGRELIELVLKLLNTLVIANRRRNKVQELEVGSGSIDALRIMLRLSMRLSFLSHKGYEVLSRDLDEIGRMLGGWLKQSKIKDADSDLNINETEGIPTVKRCRGVRFRMTSPQIERYLRVKLEHQHDIVFIKSGIFLQTFFEDAVECSKLMGLAVRDLSANGEPEKIPVCGIPVSAIEQYKIRLGSIGRTMWVDEQSI
jgi:hypothetical protein